MAPESSFLVNVEPVRSLNLKKKRKPLSLNRILCSPHFSTKFMKVFRDNLSHALVKAPWSNHTIAHGSLQS